MHLQNYFFAVGTEILFLLCSAERMCKGVAPFDEGTSISDLAYLPLNHHGQVTSLNLHLEQYRRGNTVSLQRSITPIFPVQLKKKNGLHFVSSILAVQSTRLDAIVYAIICK